MLNTMSGPLQLNGETFFNFSHVAPPGGIFLKFLKSLLLPYPLTDFFETLYANTMSDHLQLNRDKLWIFHLWRPLVAVFENPLYRYSSLIP